MSGLPPGLSYEDFRSIYMEMSPKSNRTLEEYTKDLIEVTGNKKKVDKKGIEKLYKDFTVYIEKEIGELYMKYQYKHSEKIIPKQIRLYIVSKMKTRNNNLIPIIWGYIIGFDQHLFYNSVVNYSYSCVTCGLEMEIIQGEIDSNEEGDTNLTEKAEKYKKNARGYMEGVAHKNGYTLKTCDVIEITEKLDYEVLLNTILQDQNEMDILKKKLADTKDKEICSISLVRYTRNLKKKLGDDFSEILARRTTSIMVLLRMLNTKSILLPDRVGIDPEVIDDYLEITYSKKLTKEIDINTLKCFIYSLILLNRIISIFTVSEAEEDEE